ncbi:UPF0489 family protein [Candidatus Woesearchaeota archaeon]|nr:UPF0489 family protein [Candidatus Woesearchaeota archaeon]
MNQDLEARTEEYASIKTLAKIPIAITEEHNEVYYHWEKSGIKDATLFHIDYHADTSHAELKADFSSYKDLSIVNFICAAVHKRIVSSMYWLDPYSPCQLSDMGSTIPDNRKSLKTKVQGNAITWEDKELNNSRIDDITFDITVPKIDTQSQLILDIDLDAFAMKGEEEGYKDRIDATIEFLNIMKTIKKPDLITITRSQGPDKPSKEKPSSLRVFVEPEIVDDVQEYLLLRLIELYGEK